MNVRNESFAEPDDLHATWALLDEARQVLLRAESIVVLLAGEADASEHQTYAIDVARELLGSLKEKLGEAQQLVGAPLRSAAR